MADRLIYAPDDEHNQRLIEQVHPTGYQNPEPSGKYNLVVVGAGTAGLVTASACAGLGGKVALVERHLMGGDCLNVGCVPSKIMIRSGRLAAQIKGAGEFGIQVDEARVDFGKVMERLRRLRADISRHDGVGRFSELGVDVFIGEGKFTSKHTFEVGGKTLNFKSAVIATGARAMELPIPGLKESGALTNENVFNLTELPKRLAVIGGGPIGCELAQTFQRLGSRVTQIDIADRLLAREDSDAAKIVQQALADDGVRLLLNAKTRKIELDGALRRITVEVDGKEEVVEADQILVGAGRSPNVEGLGLKDIGVEVDKDGVKVNDYLQTTQNNIYACGDVCMRHKFTHAADFAARTVIQNALFSVGAFGKKKLSSLLIPWSTYTSPEVAHVGLYPDEAEKRGIPIHTYELSMDKIDRAITEGATKGFVKIHVKKGSDQILGATIVAEQAGDMISEIGVAMKAGLGLGKLASVIHPYPTTAEAIRKVGDLYNRSRLTPTVLSKMKAWLKWRRR